MSNTDMNKYAKSNRNKTTGNNNKNSSIRNCFKISMKVFMTFILIFVITGTIVFGYIGTYVVGMVNESITYDMRATKLHLTSFIYVNDENNAPIEYDKVYNLENRIWVDFNEIPNHMKDAIISIEDKRFKDHRGVDWVRTFGAVVSLLSGKSSYGGSTLTQQLIKNLTNDNDVSIMRKIREIFRAINFEREYSKDEILEAYLNVVNFGAGCRGVETAANTYFNKGIKECSIVECAAIAGITQNPAAYNPLVFPENNQKRREIVLAEMFDQKKISKEQYTEALKESSNMKINYNIDDDEQKKSYNPVRNWYMESMFEDIIHDLSENLGIGKESAQEILFTQGLKIYSAMDLKAQSIAEEAAKNKNLMALDNDLELGYTMMGFDGRVLATIGSRKEKTANLVFDRANSARRQPGSTIKPISAYAPAIDSGLFNYSSIIPDQTLPNFYLNSSPGPNNFGNRYHGNVTLQYALEMSSNAVPARIVQALTPQVSYKFMVEKLGFSKLDETDKNSLVGFSIGGLYTGVTVREMTAAFQIFGNGGIYNKPYTYYYVLDRKGKVLLDNRDKIGERAIKSETATIMNHLLRQVIVGPSGTGKTSSIPEWDVIGKTGTTDSDKDTWFIGATPVAVAGVWSGYDTPKAISQRRYPQTIWKEIMTKYLKGKEVFDYTFDPNVLERYYSSQNGKIVNPKLYSGARKGYYLKDHLPEEDPNYRITQTIENQIKKFEKTTSDQPLPPEQQSPKNESDKKSDFPEYNLKKKEFIETDNTPYKRIS